MTITRDSIKDIWGERTLHNEGTWPERVDERTLDAPDDWVQSTCLLCSNGCALDIGVKDGKIVGVRGRKEDVVNKGRLGPKGLHGWEANNSADRLTHPLIRQDGELKPATWDEAMELIVNRTRELRDRYTASSIGFYTSGQLYLEEYYTLGVIGKAGLGTPHMDGNTRLCTATSAAALKETFGSDGQPGSYFDIDVADTILHVGHNISNTDTVLWMRILDRRAAPNPPKLVVIDPRETATAKEADIHLAPKVGTNVVLLNGLLYLLIKNGQIDREFIAEHTIGFEDLEHTVAAYPPERVAEITGLDIAKLQAAADAIGQAERLISTALQGVYQSNQATAAAVQINNINLIRGMIGRPGCGILQMNGQPTAQNTRETGADGDLPAFRNWDNEDHIQELAALWNVDPAIIPHWAPPTHALNIFHLVESGSIRMLWISATNPAVSMPDLNKIRNILEKEGLFLVVQDAFMTETAAYADVVLPAAIWGEKTGCSTNVDRTVHISHKAIEPPGEAKADLDIFLDFARRMDFRDKDGQPLIKWHTPEEAFEAWKACTRGRPCDYTGLSYAKLTGGSGIAWPCNEQYPEGHHQLYSDLQFPTTDEQCETYGHDLLTGGAVTQDEFRARAANGRAILKPAEFEPHMEVPDEDYPMWLSTGRVVYHFHTRTKTGRSPELQNKEPDAFVQLNPQDAEALDIEEGDMVRVTSRRGKAMAPARVRDIRRGHVFMPFHFGYWDEKDGRPRAANELTIFEWDPVSKQPTFKYAAVRIEKLTGHATEQKANQAGESGHNKERRDSALGSVLSELKQAVASHAHVSEKGGPQGNMGNEGVPSHVADYLQLLIQSEKRLIRAYEAVKQTHSNVPDIAPECTLFTKWSSEAIERLEPFADKYGLGSTNEAGRLDQLFDFGGKGKGSFALLRDLHDLWLLVNESMISVIALSQAAQALRDEAFLEALRKTLHTNERQRKWFLTRIKQAAPQSLIVPS
ncbi:molybdopterin oxidoreductase family protein [Modicisalibacter luteus]|nr:nitrate reductase [Halomonas lutea]GHB15835.1 molybdopterin oxidoreductase [Halomonas lutea]